jgi:cell division protein FtsB
MARRLIWMALLVSAIYFALQAGEYSTLDIIRQRKRKARLELEIDSLRRQVDSLQAVERMIRSDPKTQERIAREEFGMVRGTNEILYKFFSRDSVEESAESASQDK